MGEFDDSVLMNAFGQVGTGIFIAPAPMAAEVKKYGVVVIGQTDEVCEPFYAISVERKIYHPAVTVITKKPLESGCFGIFHIHLNEKQAGKSHEQTGQYLDRINI